jgi:hypothetical protein
LFQSIFERDGLRISEVLFGVGAIAHFAFDLGCLRLVRRPGGAEEFLALNLELVVPILAVVSADECHGIAPYGM